LKLLTAADTAQSTEWFLLIPIAKSLSDWHNASPVGFE
jgi:hypothetical protein